MCRFEIKLTFILSNDYVVNCWIPYKKESKTCGTNCFVHIVTPLGTTLIRYIAVKKTECIFLRHFPSHLCISMQMCIMYIELKCVVKYLKIV